MTDFLALIGFSLLVKGIEKFFLTTAQKIGVYDCLVMTIRLKPFLRFKFQNNRRKSGCDFNKTLLNHCPE